MRTRRGILAAHLMSVSSGSHNSTARHDPPDTGPFARFERARDRALTTLRTSLPLRRWLPAPQPDPAARMFAGIRLRMTLLYTAILALILVVAGTLLYVGMQRVILNPVILEAQSEVVDQASSWQLGTGSSGCVRGYNGFYYLEACYDSGGNTLGATKQPFIISSLASLASPALARQALAGGPNGTATDMTTVQVALDSGQGQSANGQGPAPGTVTQTRTILRYAAVLSDPSTAQILGVVEIGIDITGQAQALQTLLTLLLIVGGVTLLGCGVGGALLADRTLAPARLAFARQQAFIADASHELRTPITLLRANAEVLLRGRQQLDPQDALLLEDIVAEAAHMGALAENLLTLARLDAGVVHPEQVVDLAEVAADVARRAQSLSDERRVVLTLDHAEETLVIGDTTRLGEVALILVDNAIKYNHPGGAVTLRTYHDGRDAVLEVRDNGIGIAPEHLARLGERFYRADKARSRQMGGAGLGIAIARRIAALHGGSLSLTSAPGAGTTATLRLPAVEVTRY